MLLDVRQGLLIMVSPTFKYNAITCMCLILYEVPCESNNQKVDNIRLKIGMYLDIRKKIVTV